MLVKAFRFLSVLVVASLVLVGSAITSAAQAVSYVALGDSYSSGVGAGEYGDSGSCKRSANAYPQLWADSHGATDFQFVACLGARTDDVLTQAGALSEATTLVTVSVGGNDAGFTDVMTDCTLGGDQACVGRVADAKAFVTGTLPGLLDNVYATLRSKAPNAEIVVLGYPRFYQFGRVVPGRVERGQARGDQLRRRRARRGDRAARRCRRLHVRRRARAVHRSRDLLERLVAQEPHLARRRVLPPERERSGARLPARSGGRHRLSPSERWTRGLATVNILSDVNGS
ncbi:SGNH/GDSL hydrolase family protein [Prauserella sp. PE36]|uniref:SGNH/GDSL hydrolase family protein n=1 Tax=Prauserella sp. PE36 TaxID=1504709 RepID=UPI003514F15A